MRSPLILPPAIILTLLTAGCEDGHRNAYDPGMSSDQPSNPGSPAARGGTADPDRSMPDRSMGAGGSDVPPQDGHPDRKPGDTGMNPTDKGNNPPTPTDQGMSEGDTAITKAIRKDIMADRTLSMDAQNVKIITRDGMVTLRGRVDSEEERNRVAEAARRADGVRSVDNQVEVANH